jgi:hypothetical protein
MNSALGNDCIECRFEYQPSRFSGAALGSEALAVNRMTFQRPGIHAVQAICIDRDRR